MHIIIFNDNDVIVFPFRECRVPDTLATYTQNIRSIQTKQNFEIHWDFSFSDVAYAFHSMKKLKQYSTVNYSAIFHGPINWCTSFVFNFCWTTASCEWIFIKITCTNIVHCNKIFLNIQYVNVTRASDVHSHSLDDCSFCVIHVIS